MKTRLIILTLIVSTLLGLLLLEISYRAYVRWLDPVRFEDGRAVPEFFGIYDRSLWVFDREHGYRYATDRVINQTQISDGKVLNCEILDIVNENGNIGTSGIKYADPDFTIAVFGDSWTAFSQNGMTWPIFLQENLERETGRRINIVNYGRDGYGLLQIMRLAIDTIEETEPDLALLAFISDDIDRAPFWRSEVRINGRTRVLTSLQPTPHPKPEDAADTFVLHKDATFDWCANAKGTRDALVEDIERVYLESVKRSAVPVRALFTLRHSFIYNRLMHRNATHFASRPAQNPRLTVDSFTKLPEAKEIFASIKRSKIPLRFVHLAFHPEVDSGREYILTSRQERLLYSLEPLVGQVPLETLNYVDLPVEASERMNLSKTDFHPSIWGMKFYADTVTRMILQNQLLDNVTLSSPPR